MMSQVTIEKYAKKKSFLVYTGAIANHVLKQAQRIK